jgi:outer membrane protein assembly factor BamB
MTHRLFRAALFLASLIGLAAVFPAASLAGNWPGWRGDGTGVSDEKDLPVAWNGKAGDNVLWKAALKGMTGHSSPIVWGDKVFITTAAKQTGDQEKAKEVPEHHLSCYQAADGKLLWQTVIPQGKVPMGYAIYAVPTPVTDGKAVYCWFGSGMLAAVDFDGKVLWRQERAGPFNMNPGICSSPALFGDTMILACDQNRDLGWLQGIDKKTGEVKWEKKRVGNGWCNTAPILLDVKGKPQLILLGANRLEGLDPASGEPVWSCKAGGFGESPAYGGGILYVDRGENSLAEAIDPTGTGDVTATHVKWKVEKSPGDYSSPVVAGEYIFKTQKEGLIACLKLATGETVFTAPLDGVSKLASPVATADGRVYFVSTGKGYVLKAGPALEVLGKGDLGGGGNGSSPAFSGGKIFVRDHENLWCIGNK